VRFTANLAASTAGASFSFDVQKQLWFFRRCPATYRLADGAVEIVAEGPRAKLETFERWLRKATTTTNSAGGGEAGDGAGLASVAWTDATGELAGWTSEGAAASLAAAEGPGFMGAPTAGAADETTNDFELADAVAERVVSEIDYEAAATMAATKGVVGTVPQSVREDLVARQFGSAMLDAPEPQLAAADVAAPAADDLGLSEEELEAFARELAGQ